MPYGFIARNDNGDVIIDDNYINFFFHERKRGHVTLPSARNIQGQDYRVVNFSRVTTDQPPIIGFTGIDREAFAVGPVGEPGNWTGVLVGTYYADDRDVTLEYELHVYVVGMAAKYKDDSNYGMVVKDSSGTTTFDSRRYPLRFGGFRSLKQARIDTVGETFATLPSNCLPGLGAFSNYWETNSAGWTNGAIMAKLDGNRVKLRNMQISIESTGYGGLFPPFGWQNADTDWPYFKNPPFHQW